MVKKASPHRRLIISKNLILMLVMLVIVAVAVYSWFYSSHETTASGMSVQASRSGEVQLALPKYDNNGTEIFPKDTDFTSSIDFKETGFIDRLIKDVTGDGQNFIVPSFESSTSMELGRTVITDGIWESGLSSKEALTDDKDFNDELYNYVSLDFYARTTSRKLFVSEGSYLAALSEVHDKTLNSGTLERPTERGAHNYSSDAIVGAMRVSLEVDDITTATENSTYTPANNKQLKFVWLPRPDVYLHTDADENNWSVQYVLPSNTNLAPITYRHSFYHGNPITADNTTLNKGVEKRMYNDNGAYPDFTTVSQQNDGVSALTNSSVFRVTKISDNDANIGTAGYTPKLNQSLQISNDTGANAIHFTSSDKDYYVFKITMNVWVEGADNEARRSMNGGKFKLLLEFLGK